MNKFLNSLIILLLFPSFAFAANGYWSSMIWGQDTWYIGVGQVTGQIMTTVTGQNTPIVGGNVTVIETGQSAITGSDGSFTLNDIPIGEYTIKIQMNGFNTVQLTDVSISGGGITDLSSKEMEFGCGLKGDINDDGKINLEEAINALQSVSGIR